MSTSDGSGYALVLAMCRSLILNPWQSIWHHLGQNWLPWYYTIMWPIDHRTPNCKSSEQALPTCGLSGARGKAIAGGRAGKRSEGEHGACLLR